MKKIFFKFCGFLILVWCAGFLWFNHQINDYPNTENLKTDAIVVLTGGSNRINQAVFLLNNGVADKMFISGVSKQTSLEMIEERNDIFIAKKQKVQIGSQAQDTIGNAKEAKDWIEKNNIKSIRLVTSNYHMPRSLIEFSFQNPKIKIVPSPVYSANLRKRWWRSWGTFKLITTEYNKFLVVFISKKILRDKTDALY